MQLYNSALVKHYNFIMKFSFDSMIWSISGLLDLSYLI